LYKWLLMFMALTAPAHFVKDLLWARMDRLRLSFDIGIFFVD
jgi:hypothetical protein